MLRNLIVNHAGLISEEQSSNDITTRKKLNFDHRPPWSLSAPLSKHCPFAEERKRNSNNRIAKMYRNALFLFLVLLFAQKPSINDAFIFAVPSPILAPSVPGRASIRIPFPQSNKPRRLETASLEIHDDKPQSVAAATFSLMKAIVGSGVLALPAGLAVVSDVPKA